MYATLACLRQCYPQWDIQLEFPVWTATRRPSPTVVHFVYGKTTDELENKIRNAEAEYAPRAVPRERRRTGPRGPAMVITRGSR